MDASQTPLIIPRAHNTGIAHTTGYAVTGQASGPTDVTELWNQHAAEGMDAIATLLVHQIQDMLFHSTITHGTTPGVKDDSVLLDDQWYTDETIDTIAKIAKSQSPHSQIFYMKPLAFRSPLDASTFAAYLKKTSSHGAEKLGWDRVTNKMLSKLEKLHKDILS
ncbi:hypothetical protein KCU77_g8309, partial [Aureobasidium melanogenum]